MLKRLLLIFIFSFHTFALEIISADIPFLSSENGKYYKLIKRAALESKVDVTFKFYPIERAKRRYFTKKFDGCILPKSILSEEYREGIESIPFQKTTIYVFSLDVEYKSLSAIKNKKIGLIQGVDYGVDFKVLSNSDNNNYFHYARDTETSLLLLHKKRVDLILGFLPMIKDASMKLNKEVPMYSKNYDLITIQDTLVCHTNAENFKSLMRINKSLVEIVGEN